MRCKTRMLGTHSKTFTFHSNGISYVIQTGIIVQAKEPRDGVILTKTVGTIYFSPNHPPQVVDKRCDRNRGCDAREWRSWWFRALAGRSFLAMQCGFRCI